MAKINAKKILKQFGATPAEIDRELTGFAQAAKVLSSSRPRLIDEHPLQWIGVYEGRVAASGKTMKSLVAQLRKAGIPVERTIVRFIDKQERTLIL